MTTFTQVIDLFTFLALFVNALLYIPQIMLLLETKYANDVSLITFAGFDLINFILLIHGLIHNDKSLYVGSLVSFITNSIVVFLIIYYRATNKQPHNKVTH